MENHFNILRDCPSYLSEPIEIQSKITPLAKAIAFPGGIFTYQSLNTAINRVAAELHSGGLRQGSIVAVKMGDSIPALVASLALSRLGCACIFKLPQRQLDSFPVHACIAMGEALKGVKHIEFQANWLTDESNRVHEFGPVEVPERGTGATIYTSSSGSTGLPKIIPSSLARLHRAVVDSLNHEAHEPALSPCIVGLGLGSLWGYRQILTNLWTGGTLMFGKADISTAGYFEALGVRHIVASVHQLESWARAAREMPSFFRTVEAVTTGGGGLTPRLEETVRTHICSKIYVNYGSTETGLIAAGPADLSQKHPGSVGLILKTAKVEIVNEEGKVLADGSSGAVRARTGSMAEDEGSGKFQQGWFYTGDEGCKFADGTLAIVGRKDGVLNLAGAKLRLEESEELIRECPGIKDVALFIVQNDFDSPRLGCAFVPDTDFRRDSLLKSLAHLPTIDAMLELEAIPRGGNGKILRHEIEKIHTKRLEHSRS